MTTPLAGHFLSVAEAAAAVRLFDVEEIAEVSGERGEPAWLRTDSLVIDQRYQREIQRQGARTIRKIVSSFDWSKYSPLIVSPAEGAGGKRFAILDGQHRAVAAHILKIEHVPCMVHRLSLREQARVFRDVNATVTQVSRLALHHAGVMAGQSEAVGVHNVCQAAGVRVMTSNRVRRIMKPNETVAVQMIGKMLKAHGYDPVRRALVALVATADEATEIGSWNVRILSEAIARNAGVSDDKIAEVMSTISIEDMLEQERMKSQPGLAPKAVADWLSSRFSALEAAA